MFGASQITGDGQIFKFLQKRSPDISNHIENSRYNCDLCFKGFMIKQALPLFIFKTSIQFISSKYNRILASQLGKSIFKASKIFQH